jgi:hypothetical protein
MELFAVEFVEQDVAVGFPDASVAGAVPPLLLCLFTGRDGVA